jgi:tetraacyldisaccharide 4'-kinase
MKAGRSARFRWALLPLSWIYREIVRVRVWMYAKGLLRQRRLNAAVVSVGNLTVGGTGKTPMVIWLAERFLAQGKRVGILSRGYKGSDGTSDEIEVMRARLGNRVAFGVGADRFTNGQRLEAGGVDVFLLDDGFQHLQLARDVNILLLDASRPLEAETLLPAGRLREPLSEMGRADLLVRTRTGTSKTSADTMANLREVPVFSAATALVGWRRMENGTDVRFLDSAGVGAGPFFAFCGIGNPEAFFADLKSWGMTVNGVRAFADHHKYSIEDEREILSVARAVGATGLLTTEKDARNFEGFSFSGMPVYVAVIDLKVSDEEGFWGAITRRLEARAGA